MVPATLPEGSPPARHFTSGCNVWTHSIPWGACSWQSNPSSVTEQEPSRARQNGWKDSELVEIVADPHRASGAASAPRTPLLLPLGAPARGPPCQMPECRGLRQRAWQRAHGPTFPSSFSALLCFCKVGDRGKDSLVRTVENACVQWGGFAVPPVGLPWSRAPHVQVRTPPTSKSLGPHLQAFCVSV